METLVVMVELYMAFIILIEINIADIYFLIITQVLFSRIPRW